MLRECARGWRIYFQFFFAVSDLPFRGSVREFPLYLLGFIDFQDLAGQRIVDDWGRFEDKKFSLLASRCGWLGPARARAVGVREECEWGRDATSRRVYEWGRGWGRGWGRDATGPSRSSWKSRWSRDATQLETPLK